MPEPGDRVGPYRFVSRLGHGAMGEVWRARDERLDRYVALKVLPADHEADVETRARMMREARAAAAIRHANVVTLFDIIDYDGGDVLVMELVEGRTLAELLRKDGRPSLDRALAWIEAIADALAAAHARGILHRDIKAANVMVGSDGAVKVLDFGLAKLRDGDAAATGSASAAGSSARLPAGKIALDATIPSSGGGAGGTGAAGSGDLASYRTHAGQLLGTPLYMAPEQIRGAPPDERSEVFSVGVLAHEILAGAPPYDATTLDELFTRDRVRAVARADRRTLAGRRDRHARAGQVGRPALADDDRAPRRRRGGAGAASGAAATVAVSGRRRRRGRRRGGRCRVVALGAAAGGRGARRQLRGTRARGVRRLLQRQGAVVAARRTRGRPGPPARERVHDPVQRLGGRPQRGGGRAAPRAGDRAARSQGPRAARHRARARRRRSGRRADCDRRERRAGRSRAAFWAAGFDYRAGRYADADAEYRALLADPAPQFRGRIYDHESSVLLYLDRPDDALAIGKLYEDAFPGEADAVGVYATTLAAAGRYDDATAAAEDALRLNEGEDTLAGLAKVRALAGDRARAKELYRRSLDRAGPARRPLRRAALALLQWLDGNATDAAATVAPCLPGGSDADARERGACLFVAGAIDPDRAEPAARELDRLAADATPLHPAYGAPASLAALLRARVQFFGGACIAAADRDDAAHVDPAAYDSAARLLRRLSPPVLRDLGGVRARRAAARRGDRAAAAAVLAPIAARAHRPWLDAALAGYGKGP